MQDSCSCKHRWHLCVDLREDICFRDITALFLLVKKSACWSWGAHNSNSWSWVFFLFSCHVHTLRNLRILLLGQQRPGLFDSATEIVVDCCFVTVVLSGRLTNNQATPCPYMHNKWNLSIFWSRYASKDGSYRFPETMRSMCAFFVFTSKSIEGTMPHNSLFSNIRHNC